MPPPSLTISGRSFERNAFDGRLLAAERSPPIAARTITAMRDNEILLLSDTQRATLLAGLSRQLAAHPSEEAAVRRACMRLLQLSPSGSTETTLQRLAQTHELGVVVQALTLDHCILLGTRGGFDFNAIAAQTNSVRVRGLTVDEIARARRNFGSSIDFARVRLNFETVAPTGTSLRAIVLGNTVNAFEVGESLRLEPGTTRPAADALEEFEDVVLAHELMHVWQYQHEGGTYATTALNEQIAARGSEGGSAYTYTLVRGRPLSSYGHEQQGRIMADYSALRRAVERGEENPRVLTDYLPLIREVQQAGAGVSEPALVGAATDLDSYTGSSRAVTALGTMLPQLASGLGSHLRGALATRDYAAATFSGLVLGALAYQRGTIALDEASVPHVLRFGDSHVGLSAGLSFGAQLSDATPIVGIDARGQIGNYTLEWDSLVSGTATSLNFAQASLSVRGRAAQGAMSLYHSPSLTRGAFNFSARAAEWNLSAQGRFELDETGDLRSAEGSVRVAERSTAVELYATTDAPTRGSLSAERPAHVRLSANTRLGDAAASASATLTPAGDLSVRAALSARLPSDYVATFSGSATARALTLRADLSQNSAPTTFGVSLETTIPLAEAAQTASPSAQINATVTSDSVEASISATVQQDATAVTVSARGQF